ncbi:hypothetical protein K6U06_11070 [Acidiferrimicrobium sp. IK]|uniref:TrmH family RNA methyltransferase n=1 Tax=Acidiferrimicrobium sp. IK TaxID=2871700 RepID=UPI0021CB65B0|nr:TrmH family RNA methyltransferase [Acidiferrimicrobium sp. IK]MCU4184902.1 hypothetical protein [Acidiferrimicrobium sp. IK]
MTGGAGPGPVVVAARNDRFQQWQALLTNRRARQRLGRFLIQGVVPITVAVERGWPLDALLYRPGPLSSWARDVLGGPAVATRIQLPAELLSDLGGRDDGPPELLAVARTQPDDLGRIGPDVDLVLIGDRTSSPGNLGTMIRTADALGAGAVVVTGHAADPYDPQAVRASRGSLFALPVVRQEGPDAVLSWLRRRPQPFQVVGASEDATHQVWARDWRPPTAVVIGNEAAGLSRAWAEACDALVAIPQSGSASSLNAAVSASIVLYEIRRYRTVRGGSATLR